MAGHAKILVADDNADTADTTAALLGICGAGKHGI